MPIVRLVFARPTVARVSIVIPVYKGLEHTRACLGTLKENTAAPYEVIVVDNASDDGTGAFLAAVEGIQVLANARNLGFAKACNMGAARTRGEYLLFLNNDTVPTAGWLERMLETAERREDVGAVGSRLLYPHDGTVQHAGVIFNSMGLPYHIFRHNDGSAPEALGEKQIPAVTGACLLTRRDIFMEAGGFNEGYLNGLEDIDYCLVLRAMGWKSWYNGDSLLYHHESMTTGRLDRVNEESNLAFFRSRWEGKVEPDDPADFIPPGAQNKKFRSYRAGHCPLQHSTGTMEGILLVCRSGVHEAGHCVYGPGLIVLASQELRVNFHLQVSPNAAPDARAASLDTYDNNRGKILMHRSVTAGEVRGYPYGVSLSHQVEKGQNLEFRVYWHGDIEVSFARVALLFSSI